jgi:hypothetical protein
MNLLFTMNRLLMAMLLATLIKADVRTLRASQFNDFVQEREHVLVNFYSTECGFWYIGFPPIC